MSKDKKDNYGFDDTFEKFKNHKKSKHLHKKLKPREKANKHYGKLLK